MFALSQSVRRLRATWWRFTRWLIPPAVPKYIPSPEAKATGPVWCHCPMCYFPFPVHVGERFAGVIIDRRSHPVCHRCVPAGSMTPHTIRRVERAGKRLVHARDN